MGKCLPKETCTEEISQRDLQVPLGNVSTITQSRDYLIDLDGQLVRKFSKRRFLKDILISFQWITQMGLETLKFFSFQNISTNTVARGVQILGRYGP